MSRLPGRNKRGVGMSGAVAVALTTATSAAWGGTIRHDVPDTQYQALATNYPSVGRLLFATDDTFTRFNGICSATLIAPDFVLTAAHCIDTQQGQAFQINGEQRTVVERIPHPRYTGRINGGYDIGLARLSAPITTVTPATRSRSQDFIPREATIVGFGATGNGITGIAASSGTKRAGTNVLDSVAVNVDGFFHYFIADFDDPASSATYTNDGINFLGSADPLPLEYQVAGGDSGGGVFAVSGGENVVVAVNSFGFAPTVAEGGDGNFNADYGDGSGFTRVVPFNAFIDANIPEPTTLLLLGVGAVLLMGRRSS